MSITIPTERVYYYECSNSRFRLTLFIPKSTLQNYAENHMINKKVIVDFPDGCDIDCTEPDFRDFENQYSYKPDIQADLLCKSFESIWSSTNKWKSYKGTGYISAPIIESNAKQLRSEISHTIKLSKPSVFSTFDQHPENKINILNKKMKFEKAVKSFIHKREYDNVDKSKNLGAQLFSSIAMENEDTAESFFNFLNKYN